MTDILTFFLKGIFLGFSIAAPVGPIGLLCFRRTLESGFWAGLSGGLGTAVADAFYAAFAAFGVTAASAFFIQGQTILQIVGTCFLLWLGARTLLSPPAEQAAAVRSRGLAMTFAATFLLTITNPMTILSFAAVFAGLGLVGTDANSITAGSLVAGVFGGSLLWWAILSGSTSVFRNRIGRRVMLWIHRTSGVLLLGFGVWMVLRIF